MFRRGFPSWANAEKLKAGRKAEKEAGELFVRTFVDTAIKHHAWDSLIDAHITDLEGERVGYLEFKSHTTSLAYLALDARARGMYEFKAGQFDWAAGTWRERRLPTVLMARFQGVWHWIENLALVTPRERGEWHWRNCDGVRRTTEMVYLDLRLFKLFPTTPGLFVSQVMSRS